MKCSKCGNELNENDLFCGKCGNKIVKNPKKNNQKSDNVKKKNKKIIGISIVILIVCGLLYVTANIYIKNNEKRVENNTHSNNLDKIYLDVLEEKTTFTISYNNSIENFTLGEWLDKTFGLYALEIHYCIFDIDNDNLNEMYVEIELPNLNDTAIIILNEEDGNIYGFDYPSRGITNLKTDGTYMSSSGVNVFSINRVTFKETELNEIYVAFKDEDTYIVNSKNATEQEFNTVLEEFNSKQNIQLVDYKFSDTNMSNDNKDLNVKEETVNNVENIDTVFNNDTIKDRVENSYFRLINDINSYNISVVTKNQDRKAIAIPKSGKVYALYNKQNQKLQYIQYYGGPYGGTEIIWIDLEGDAEYSVFEGQYGQKVMKPYIIKAVNVYGNVLDRRNESVEFSMNSAILQMIENKDNVTTDEGKAIINGYVLKKFNWSVDSEDEIVLEETN